MKALVQEPANWHLIFGENGIYRSYSMFSNTLYFGKIIIFFDSMNSNARFFVNIFRIYVFEHKFNFQKSIKWN